jgi:hypothetical protein
MDRCVSPHQGRWLRCNTVPAQTPRNPREKDPPELGILDAQTSAGTPAVIRRPPMILAHDRSSDLGRRTAHLQRAFVNADLVLDVFRY